LTARAAAASRRSPKSAGPEPTRSRRRAVVVDIVVPVAIAAATFVAFLPVLSAEFVSWDDEKNFLENPHYRGLGITQLRWMWSTFHLGHYVPLSWMTLGADYDLWGINAGGYHLTSLLLHALNAVLVYFCARRILRLTLGDREGDDAATTAGAVVAACVFSMHPLRVESVAWITERRDVLSGAFMFGCTVLYLRNNGERSARAHPRRDYWLTVLLFACAVLSKATAMTLPAVLLLLNVYPLGRLGSRDGRGWLGEHARRVYVELVPFALIAAATALLSIIALHPPPQLDFVQKLAVSAYGLAFYLAKTVVPVRLSPLYSMPLHVSATDVRFLAAYVGVLALALCMWLLRRRAPGLVVSLLAFVVITLPMLGLVQNGPQIAADRYTYHASPALALLLGAGALIAWRLTSTNVVAATSLVVIAALGVLTWRQTLVWHDSLTLWSRVLELDPNAPIAHSAYATLMFRAGNLDEATVHSERAVALAPDYAEAHNNLGVALARHGKYAEAVEQYQRVLALEPRNDEAYNNLGVVTVLQGDVARAMDYYRTSLELNPDNAGAEINWGNAFVRLRRYADAIPHYRQALIIRPDQSDAHLNWGVALAQQGSYADAIEHFRTALALDPSNAEAQRYLDRATELLQRR
jgi:protein O-mannosyl-transferase